MTFTHLLHDLIGLNGRAVTVTASSEGTVALACSGVMSGGVDVLEADAGEREALYFPLTGTADGGFLIVRRASRRAGAGDADDRAGRICQRLSSDW